MVMQRARITPLGLNIDIDSIELNGSAWQRTDNMVARPGHMERAKGYKVGMGTPLFDPYYLLYSPQLNDPYWVYCGTDNIGTIDDGAVHADITPTEFTNSALGDAWTGGNLNGIAVVNNPANVPFYWFEGQGTAQPLPGQRNVNTRYEVMRPFKYHLIGMGVNDSAGQFLDQVHWSNAADPGNVPDTWVPAPDNEAGDNILADENGAIIDGLALRDGFYIYKQDSVYEMSYVGGNAVFRFRKVFGTTGVLARNCVVEVEGKHIVLGNGDIYEHDGQNLRSIIDGVARDTFFASIDQDSYQNSFAIYNQPRQEVWFCVPRGGQSRPNLALVYSVVTGAFGYRDLPECDYGAPGVLSGALITYEWNQDPRTWTTAAEDRWSESTLSRVEEGVALADAPGRLLFEGNSTQTANGEPYVARLEVQGLDLGDPHVHKGVRRIWPRINSDSTQLFNIQVYTQDSANTPAKLVVNTTFTPGDEGVPVTANARYFGVRLSSFASLDWNCAGFDVDYVVRGLF